MTTKYECDWCGDVVSVFQATRYEVQSAARGADKDPVADFDLCSECSDAFTSEWERMAGERGGNDD